MQYVPVTIASGLDGRVTKKALRESLRANPDGIIFRVESEFHGPGDLINGHHAVNRDWSLEVHENQASVAVVEFHTENETHALQAVVR